MPTIRDFGEAVGTEGTLPRAGGGNRGSKCELSPKKLSGQEETERMGVGRGQTTAEQGLCGTDEP